MTTIENIQDLALAIEEITPDARIDFTHFPSGSAMLDVCVGGRLYVLSYSPAHGFGVDEVHDGEGFQLGYRYVYDDFESAANRLRKFVGHTAPIR